MPNLLCSRDITNIEGVGKFLLINKATLIKVLQEDQSRGLGFDKLNIYTKHLIYGAFHNQETRLKDEMRELYETLLEFKLTEPGGYGWAFEEVGKNRL